MMSTGSRASRPNIRKNGVYPVDACMLVLYARQSFGRCVSHVAGLSLADVASILSKFRLNLSTSPSPCGW